MSMPFFTKAISQLYQQLHPLFGLLGKQENIEQLLALPVTKGVILLNLLRSAVAEATT